MFFPFFNEFVIKKVFANEIKWDLAKKKEKSGKYIHPFVCFLAFKKIIESGKNFFNNKFIKKGKGMANLKKIKNNEIKYELF